MNHSDVLTPNSSIDEVEIDDDFKRILKGSGVRTVKEAVTLEIAILMPMMEGMGWYSTLRDLETLNDLRLMCARY